ncbi:MAG: hypothetical protein ACRDG3_00810, partial [Tepidiformaceae bacterium]
PNVPGAPTSAKTSPGGAASGGGAVCGRIARADAQALLPATIKSAADDVLGDCIFTTNGGAPLTITTYSSDPDQQYYKTLSGAADHQISGIGDEAYWNEPVPGRTSPELNAHKGDVTCVIQPNDPPDTTLKTTPSGAGDLYTVTDADALAYVQLMGKVCNDVFSK